MPGMMVMMLMILQSIVEGVGRRFRHGFVFLLPEENAAPFFLATSLTRVVVLESWTENRLETCCAYCNILMFAVSTECIGDFDSTLVIISGSLLRPFLK